MGVLAAAAFLGACAPPPAPPAPSPTLEVPRLAAVPPPPADPPDTVRFGREPARVGDHTHMLVTGKSTYLDPRSGPPAEVTTYDSDYDEEVLAVSGPAATRVKVTFTRNERFDNIQTYPTVIDGKAYLVDVSAPNVLDAQTQLPPSGDEIALVLNILPDLGTRTAVDQGLPDRPLKIGDSHDALAGAILRMMHPRYWALDRGSASLESVDRQTGMAKFKVAIAATSVSSSMAIDLTGIAIVRFRDSKLAQYVLSGSFTRPDGGKGTFETSRLAPSVISP